MNWLLNFLCEPCGVIVAATGQAVLLRRGRYRWQQALYFNDGYDKDSTIATVLRRWSPSVPVYLVIDDGSENFHSEQLATTGRRDRQLLLRRIQQKTFADSSLVRVQCRGNKVSMSALNMESTQCLQLIESMGVTLAGIYTPATLLQQLALNRGWLRHYPNLLVLSLHALSGLRQTAFANGNILFSRRIALVNGTWPDSNSISSELARVINYWQEQGANSAGNKLVLYMPKQPAEVLRQLITASTANYTIKHYSYQEAGMYPACDVVLARQLGCKLTRGTGYPVAQAAAWSRLRLTHAITRVALLMLLAAAPVLLLLSPRTEALRHQVAELDKSIRGNSAIAQKLPRYDDRIDILQRQTEMAAILARQRHYTYQVPQWLGQAGIYDSNTTVLREMEWNLSGEIEHARLVLLITGSTAMADILTVMEQLIARLNETSPPGFAARVENEAVSMRDDNISDSSIVLKLRLEPLPEEY